MTQRTYKPGPVKYTRQHRLSIDIPLSDRLQDHCNEYQIPMSRIVSQAIAQYFQSLDAAADNEKAA